MKNITTVQRLQDELVLREATNNIKVETTYCTKCGHNHYDNIGKVVCVKCGKNK